MNNKSRNLQNRKRFDFQALNKQLILVSALVLRYSIHIIVVRLPVSLNTALIQERCIGTCVLIRKRIVSPLLQVVSSLSANQLTFFCRNVTLNATDAVKGRKRKRQTVRLKHGSYCFLLIIIIVFNGIHGTQSLTDFVVSFFLPAALKPLKKLKDERKTLGLGFITLYQNLMTGISIRRSITNVRNIYLQMVLLI